MNLDAAVWPVTDNKLSRFQQLDGLLDGPVKQDGIWLLQQGKAMAKKLARTRNPPVTTAADVKSNAMALSLVINVQSDKPAAPITNLTGVKSPNKAYCITDVSSTLSSTILGP